MHAYQEEGVDHQLCGDDREEDGGGGFGGEDDIEHLPDGTREEEGGGGEKQPEYEYCREKYSQYYYALHSCTQGEEAEGGHLHSGQGGGLLSTPLCTGRGGGYSAWRGGGWVVRNMETPGWINITMVNKLMGDNSRYYQSSNSFKN